MRTLFAFLLLAWAAPARADRKSDIDADGRQLDALAQALCKDSAPADWQLPPEAEKACPDPDARAGESWAAESKPCGAGFIGFFAAHAADDPEAQGLLKASAQS